MVQTPWNVAALQTDTWICSLRIGPWFSLDDNRRLLFGLILQEEAPIEADGNDVADNRSNENGIKSIIHLQPAAGCGAERPSKLPAHAHQAGDCRSGVTVHILHDAVSYTHLRAHET